MNKMANYEMNGFDELARQLEQVSDLDGIAPEMLNEALPILESELKKTVREEADKGYATGDMEQSIKKSRARRNQYGYFGIVRPTGKDKKGIRNMEKLAYLHYGTSKQPARPVVTKAVFRAESKIIGKMQECYNRMVES